jgi:ECF sigma factor
MSARVMRRILVDSARARGNDKRGGGIPKVSLDEGLLAAPQAGADLVALDAALHALEAVHPRKSQVVERFAKLWLLRELNGARPDGL